MKEESPEHKRVVGIKYEQGKGLPQVILKGGGIHAEAIIRKSKATSGTTIVRDEKLLQQLYRLPVDAEIGTDLFRFVAMLLVHVYAVEEKYNEDRL